MKALYEIGTRFVRRTRKAKREEEIIDILTTYNSKNEIVGIEYITQQLVAGQFVQNTALNSTIGLSIII